MGRFDEYITGKLEMTIGKEKLELDITLDDKRVFKAIKSEDGGITEDKLKRMDDKILEILTKSYPDEKPEALKALYSNNDELFLNELLISFGWIKREDLKVKKKEVN